VNNENELDFEAAWDVIRSSLSEMHERNASQLSFETIYRHCYKIILKKKGDVFYERLQRFEKDWLTQRVRSDLKTLLSPVLLESPTSGAGGSSTGNERRSAGEKFSRGLKDAFEAQQLVMKMSTDVFMYCDRVYCTDTRKPSIYSAGMMIFRDSILRATLDKSAPTILEITNDIILRQIALERAGDVIDKSLIRSCVAMLEGLFTSNHEIEEERLYLTSFEPLFLEASREFYQQEAKMLLDEADAATYCRKASKRIHEEGDRCQSTLLQSTAPKIIKVVEDELIKNHIGSLIAMETGVKQMVDNDRYTDLELVYELNARIDQKKGELTSAIQKRVQEVGAAVNETAANTSQIQQPSAHQEKDAEGKPIVDRTVNLQTVAAIQWVDDILRLKDKYDHLWEVSLHSDPVIQPALTKSFTDTINSFPRSSEYISLFIDENMKKGLKDKTEGEVDIVLDKAIILLRYIQDKDLFERYYKKHLCKRLLMGKSVSIDVEKQMISRMKVELGNSFTSKLEAMFKDMSLSEELTAGYRTRVAGSSESKRVDLGVHVLTSMTWPLETMATASENDDKLKCIFPEEIERIKKGFENFYAEKHSGRMLTWMSNMGTADIRAVFPKIAGKEASLGKERRHELNVSTYAMVILMLFNDLSPDASLSFEEIQRKTNIGTNELMRNLQSLAVAPKTRVLRKEPMTKDVKRTDSFSFNASFQSKFVKIKVGVVAAGNKVEGEKERRDTEKKNNDGRGYAIEAAVVRIMK